MHPGTYLGTIGVIFTVLFMMPIALKVSGPGLPPLSANIITQYQHDMP